MTKKIERTINTSDTTNSVSIALNSSTATTVFVANSKRIKVTFINNTDYDIWVRERAAGADNTKDGYFIPRHSTAVTIPDNNYIGEYSAIAVSESPTINAVEM